MTAALFLIGLRGPGLPTNPYTTLKDEDDDEKVLEDFQDRNIISLISSLKYFLFTINIGTNKSG